EEPATLIDWGDTTRGDPASDLGALLLHAPYDALLGTYRDEAAWTGIDDDITWDALVARSWAWATRMALSLVIAYPIEHWLGATGHRLLTSRSERSGTVPALARSEVPDQRRNGSSSVARSRLSSLSWRPSRSWQP